MGNLSDWAQWAAIAGTALAVWTIFGRWNSRRQHDEVLVSYLKSEKESSALGNKGQRSLVHLERNLPMSQVEIVSSANRQPKLVGKVNTVDRNTKRADAILYEYIGP